MSALRDLEAEIPPAGDGAPRRASETRRALNMQSVALTLVSTVIGATALHLAAGLIVPIVLSLLVAGVLVPVVRVFERLGITRWLASAITVMGLVVTLGGLTYSLSDNLTAALNRLPEATSRLQQQLRALRGQSTGPIRAIERAADNIEAAASEAAGVQRTRPAASQEPALRLRESLVVGTMTIVGFTGSAVMLVLFVYFVLASGDLFKRKLVQLAGPRPSERRVTTEIIDDINEGVEHFLVVMVSMNLVVAAATWAALYALGVAHAGMWAIVGGTLNTIPYFGSAVATAVFFLVGLLQFDRLDMAALVGGAFLVITNIESSWLTPRLLVRTARMNNVAMFLGLFFWGWLWGAWGLLLAFPMMMVIKVISDRLEPLRPLGELLGD